VRAYNTTQKIILACGALILIGVLSWGVAYLRKPIALVSTSSEQPTTTPPADNLPPKNTFPLYKGEPVQTLNPNAEFLKQVPPDVFEKSKMELVELSSKLQKQPNSPSDWFRVAFIKHFYGDEIGTRDAYLYLIAIKPDDTISIYNLAVLYGYYLKDSKEAITYFERALKLDPNNESFYLGLADFYRDAEKNYVMVEKILLLGITVLPNSVNLMSALAQNYVLMSRFDLAIVSYEKLLTVGGITPEYRESVMAELNRLRAK